ncbi:MAG: transglycosylase SLT domain-containing protein [Bdellovibrionales bacterium]|nr:transglycosylase SLT domain-containing protein [Bdellovibrionales bacterium]
MSETQFKAFIFQLSHKLILIISLTTSLAACGPDQNPIGKVNSDEYLSTQRRTGNTKLINQGQQNPIAVPYTISGSQKIFNNMRHEMESVTDVLLAKTIESVIITLTDDNGERVTKAPARAEISVQLKSVHAGLPKKLNFSAKLTKKDQGRIATGIAQSDITPSNFPFTADLKCHEDNCRVIEVRLKKYPVGTNLAKVTSITPFGQVGILYRFSYPKMRIQHSRDTDGLKGELFTELEKSVNTSQPIRTSVVVVNGPSYSNIQVENILELDTELLDTEETSIDITSVKTRGSAKFDGKLKGNDPSSGSLIVDLKDQSTQEIARLYFEEEDDEPTASPTLTPTAPTQPKGKSSSPVIPVITDSRSTSIPTTTSSNSDSNRTPTIVAPSPNTANKTLFKVKLDATALPETTRVSTAFANYATDPQVQKFVRSWLGEPGQVGCKNTKGSYQNTPQGLATLTQFLTYTPNVAPHLERVVEKVDVTPEVGYLLLLESGYSKNPSYPTQERSSRSTALGPWQILIGTALDIRKGTNPVVPFQIFKNNDPRDDRTYFMNSTYMASLYLENLFDQFKEDPALAILAYHGGPGSAAQAERKTSTYSQFNTSLSEIQKYNIQTKTNCNFLNYTYTFLAARTIGQNLEFYGLDNITPAKTDAYKTRLKSPNGTLPAGL